MPSICGYKKFGLDFGLSPNDGLILRCQRKLTSHNMPPNIDYLLAHNNSFFHGESVNVSVYIIINLHVFPVTHNVI